VQRAVQVREIWMARRSLGRTGMNKRVTKKLVLQTQTVRAISHARLDAVVGGRINCSCRQHCPSDWTTCDSW
jgi:hypothetical protein